MPISGSEPAQRRSQSSFSSMLPAFQTIKKRSASTRYATKSSRIPPSSKHKRQICAEPISSLVGGLVSSLSREPPAFLPVIQTLPMSETSKIPAPERTALCSSRIEVYQTGNSQPAKSIILAPSSRCTSLRGVFFSSLIISPPARESPRAFASFPKKQREDLSTIGLPCLST